MSLNQESKFPKLTSGSIRIWQRNFKHYRKNWKASLLWTCVEPVLYLVALGFGLGAYVQTMDGASYVEFFFPGLLCLTAMTVAFFETTYSTFPKTEKGGNYEAALLTRLSVEDIAFGEIFWAASKAFFGCVGVSFIALLMGLVESAMILPSFLILFLLAWLFAAIGIFVTATVRSADSFVFFTSGLLIPMSLLCGVYFPIAQLPVALQAFSWGLPLTHATSAIRLLMAADMTWLLALNVVLLLIGAAVVTVMAVSRMRERLMK